MSYLDDNKEQQDTKDEDIIQSTIGNFGRWQFKMSSLMALLKFPIAWFQMSIVFLAPPMQFWCKSSDPHSNSTKNEFLRMIQQNVSLLKHEGLNTGFCQSIRHDNNSDLIIACPNGYEYNTTIFHSSIITEWNLVCDNKRLVDISQITLMLGVLIGKTILIIQGVPVYAPHRETYKCRQKYRSKNANIGNIFFGIFADRQGRKKTLLICIVLQSLFGIAAARIPWYWGFVVARFFMAVANGGTTVTSFVMCMEVVGGKWRSIVPILYQIPYGFGNSIMAGLAYFYRDWRDIQLALSLLSAFYILYIWFVPESPRWLFATGRKEEAIDILQNAAKCNKLDVNKVQIVAKGMSSATSGQKKASLGELFANRELTKRNLLLWLNWLIAGITFYAFSQYVGKVGSNLYLTAALSGFVAFPGTLLCVCIIRRYGRRITIAAAHIITAICFFGILAIPTGVYDHDWPRVAIAGVGIVGLSISIPAMYLFTGELFPTTIRNAGVGTSVMFTRMGSMIAPLVIAMQDISPSLPLIFLGVGGFIETVLILPLPETKGVPLLDTVQDLEIRVSDDEGKDKPSRCYISLPASILREENMMSLNMNRE